MFAYRCYVPALKNVSGHAVIITANSSFEARKAFAAMHTAMELGDCVAVREY